MNSARVKRDGTKSRKSKKQNPMHPATPINARSKMVTLAASKIKNFSLPSVSPIVTAETASIGSSPKAGPSFLNAVVPLSVSKDMDREEIQKERYEEMTPLQIPNQSRMPASTAKAVSKIEPINLDEGVEVIDLTDDSSMVDLTYNDFIVLTEESRQQQNQELSLLFNVCVVCNDNDNECSESDELAASKLPRELVKERFGSSKSSGTVSCPICMDDYAEIIHSGRLIMSTKCGHIFCSLCLQNSLKSASFCPGCRKKLNHKQYHPIYI